MDKIYIEGLEVFSLIGVYDWERVATQRLLVDVAIYTDLSRAAATDNVENTFNYADVAACVTNVAEKSQFKLIEALASEMINMIFSQFKVERISLKLSKPDILPNAKNVAVEFTRDRPH